MPSIKKYKIKPITKKSNKPELCYIIWQNDGRCFLYYRVNLNIPLGKPVRAHNNYITVKNSYFQELSILKGKENGGTVLELEF